MTLQKEIANHIHRRIEIPIGIIDTGGILGKKSLEVLGHGWGGMADLPKHTRGVEAQVPVDECGVIRMNDRVANPRKSCKPVGGDADEQALGGRNREVQRVGDDVAKRAWHGFYVLRWWRLDLDLRLSEG